MRFASDQNDLFIKIGRIGRQPEWHNRPIIANKPKANRYRQRQSGCLCHGFRNSLGKFDGKSLIIINRHAAGGQFRRSGLRIPASKARQINTICIGKCRHKIIAGYCRPVMALKIKIGAAPKPILAKIAGKHANDLSAFFIYRRRIKIIDLTIAFRPDRVRCWAAVFGKLRGAKHRHIIGAL